MLDDQIVPCGKIWVVHISPIFLHFLGVFSHNFEPFLATTLLPLWLATSQSLANLHPPDQHHRDHLVVDHQPRLSTSTASTTLAASRGILNVGFHHRCHRSYLFPEPASLLRQGQPPKRLLLVTAKRLTLAPSTTTVGIITSGSLIPNAWAVYHQ